MKKALILFCSLVVVACGTTQPTIYYWNSNNFAKSSYAYLNDEADLLKQVELLEKDIQKANQQGKAIPPGFYAHLGLIHSKLGDLGQMNYYFGLEKQYFPESAQYIQFLQNRSGRP